MADKERTKESTSGTCFGIGLDLGSPIWIGISIAFFVLMVMFS
jgi:hypothetical protein